MNKNLLLYLIPLVLLSCKKQGQVTPEPAKALASIRNTNINGHSILTSYSYNNNGRLYLETTKDESTGAILFQEYRHQNGVLHISDILNDTRKFSKIEYTYASDKVTKMRYFEIDQYLNAEFLFERNFEYQNGRIYKVSTMANTGQAGEYTLFTFSGDNVAETKTYAGNGTLLLTAQYEYDNKINPYFGLYNHLFIITGYNKSNITKSVQIDHMTNGIITTRYAYTYNSANQPIAQFLASNLQQALITFNY